MHLESSLSFKIIKQVCTSQAKAYQTRSSYEQESYKLLCITMSLLETVQHMHMSKA